MRGSIKRRYKGSWSVILDLGREPDATGRLVRKQKWVTVRGTRKQAEDKLTEAVRAANRNEYIEPSKLTVGAWLTDWLEACVTPPLRRPGTYSRYADIIRKHLRPSALGRMLLQRVRPVDVEQVLRRPQAGARDARRPPRGAPPGVPQGREGPSPAHQPGERPGRAAPAGSQRRRCPAALLDGS